MSEQDGRTQDLRLNMEFYFYNDDDRGVFKRAVRTLAKECNGLWCERSADSVTRQHPPDSDLYQTGKKFVDLGEALMNEGTDVATLLRKAGELGMKMEFSLTEDKGVKL